MHLRAHFFSQDDIEGINLPASLVLSLLTKVDGRPNSLDSGGSGHGLWISGTDGAGVWESRLAWPDLVSTHHQDQGRWKVVDLEVIKARV